MCPARTFCIAALAIAVALLPHGADAAGYSHFVSRVFHFSIDYPRGWQLKLDLKRRFQSFGFAQPGSVTVNYFSASSGLDLRTLTTRVAEAYRNSGFKTGQVTYSHGVGRFNATAALGNQQLQTRMVTMVRPKGLYAIDLTSFKSQFNAAVGIYNHMVASFRSG